MATPSPSALRDAAIFLAGLGLMVHESVFRSGPERPSHIAGYLAMMGLVAFLRRDGGASPPPDGGGPPTPPPVGTSSSPAPSSSA